MSVDAAKLKVVELRSQLQLRGLETSGTKPTLVQRLAAALREEEEDNLRVGSVESTDLVAPNKGRKRTRATEDGLADQNGSAAERIRKMGLPELRQEAARMGVSADGCKKAVLVEKLVAAIDSSGKKVHGDGKEIEVSGKEKLVTATQKGGGVLDQWLPEHIKAGYHVLQEGDEIYSAMLNQTNVGANNNKFYVIQALESDGGATFMVYNRWGRVGVRGQDKLHGPYTSKESAIDEFEGKFFLKTKNHWSDRKGFVCYPKSYVWLEMDYGDTKHTVHNKPDKCLHAPQTRETKLEPRLAQFISLICNVSMMRQQMLEIGYNADKLPLGKLSKSTILKGYEVLKRISTIIGKNDRKQLELLSGEFYTIIPHDFGFKKMRDFVIDSPFKLKCKLEMVEALDEIEIATRILSSDLGCQDDPIYSHYQNLQCDLIPVEAGSKEFLTIKQYMLNTHGKTHSNYSVDIVQIFEVSRKGEYDRFKKFSGVNNRMLLWHGSRLTNWAGILSQGLRIAPPEAPVTGYMFGKGVYFADMFSKSANYCYASSGSRTGVLLLCEVALGDMQEFLAANYDADCLPQGKLSTKGVGATAPDPSSFQTLDDGVIVPLGPAKEQPGPKGSLLYNEYIVYNVEQVKMRFVVQVDFNFRSNKSIT